jgi:hypothetical protein
MGSFFRRLVTTDETCVKNILHLILNSNLLIVCYCIFRKVRNQLLDFLPAFVDNREPVCGVDLGLIEPRDYPANYMVDEKFPVIDAETNVSRTE